MVRIISNIKRVDPRLLFRGGPAIDRHGNVMETVSRRNLVNANGFTLIELLVVIVIIAIISGISIFGINGARESGRDAKRKSDLASIQSALELYRSDCGRYPNTLGTSITGTGGLGISCNPANIYMDDVPNDPQGGGRIYRYRSFGSGGVRYALCASLEQTPAVPDPEIGTTNGCNSTNCGGGTTCNYMVKSP